MKSNIPEIIEVLNSTFKADISLFDSLFVKKTVQRRTQELNVIFIEDYSKYLKGSLEEQITLYHALHNHYTEFYRNPLSFDVIKQIIFPMLIKQLDAGINIWLPTCSSGQEAYSMAIIIDELEEYLSFKDQIKIFASDICENEINIAQKGIYSKDSLSKLTLNQFEKYFTKDKDDLSIISKIKSRIEFAVFDLFSENTPEWKGNIVEKFNIIMCSNMLLYYNEDGRKKIIKKLEKHLKNEGVLIVGEVERDILFKENYKELFYHSAIFSKANLK